MNYRSELFDGYDVHAASLDAEDSVKVRWFAGYLRANYLPHVKHLSPSSSTVLEIGSSKGYLLAALRSEGFERLNGVDLSPNDVEAARTLVPDADLRCADAREFLAQHPGAFDLILAKAVLEHVPKTDVLPFLQAIRTGLTPGGIALVDVPNMDWIFAGHERYMDFTHEVGFTRESLRQVAGAVFSSVQIFPIDGSAPYGLEGVAPARTIRLRRWRRRVAQTALGLMLRWAEPDGGAGPIWDRGLLGVMRP